MDEVQPDAVRRMMDWNFRFGSKEGRYCGNCNRFSRVTRYSGICCLDGFRTSKMNTCDKWLEFGDEVNS